MPKQGNPNTHADANLFEAGQAMALATLRAEMQALSWLLPGRAAAASDAEAEARERQGQADTEAGFDNMPV